jgi:hypothetical protein
MVDRVWRGRAADYERAVVAPAARELLVEVDERVVHYDDVLVR